MFAYCGVPCGEQVFLQARRGEGAGRDLCLNRNKALQEKGPPPPGAPSASIGVAAISSPEFIWGHGAPESHYTMKKESKNGRLSQRIKPLRGAGKINP